MKNEKSTKYPAYLTYQLFTSEAFRHLAPSARDVLILTLYEVRFSQSKKRGKYTPVVLNRNELIIPYAEIKSRLRYSDKTIWSAFRQIMAHGFLKVVKHGGGAKHDYQVYGLSEEWRKWKPGEVVEAIRKNGKSGWQKK